MNFSRVPTKGQLEFQNWEFGVFFHFGIRTFYEGHKDWDNLEMPPQAFMPTALDCESWIRTVKEAGARYAVLVTKHHDGFANWPSRFSSYSVANTPWKDGRGDVVKEFTDACRKYGVKVGLYYSPAQFGYRDWTHAQYDDYFINQITELLSNYGKIDYLWFDGCGSEDHEYDQPRIVSAIRSLQPEILLFNMWDPDTRWVGNESGVAGLENTSYVRQAFTTLNAENESRMARDGACLPAECDCCMRGHDWFYSENNESKLKTAQELFGLYCRSVGSNANLLINIGPDRRGLLPQKDAQLLLELGQMVRQRFAQGVVSRQFTADTHNGCKQYTCILAKEEADEALISGVVLGEDLTAGEAISRFRVDVLPSRTEETRKITVYRGEGIGHKRICLFPAVRAAQVQVVLEQAEPDAKLHTMEVVR